MNGTLKPESASSLYKAPGLTGSSQFVNNSNQNSNSSVLSEIISRIANRPVQTSIQIGEREIVKAIAKPLQNEMQEMKDLETLFEGGRLNER